MEKVDNIEIIPEPEWEYLLGKLIRYKGVALIIGETDSGKSTIGLGIVLLHSAGSTTFKSPVKSTKRINRVILGDITI
ncbi:MAG: hypothetical protein WC769_10080 [Thermodesulfovibrionales bacterium]